MSVRKKEEQLAAQLAEEEKRKRRADKLSSTADSAAAVAAKQRRRAEIYAVNRLHRAFHEHSFQTFMGKRQQLIHDAMMRVPFGSDAKSVRRIHKAATNAALKFVAEQTSRQPSRKVDIGNGQNHERHPASSLPVTTAALNGDVASIDHSNAAAQRSANLTPTSMPASVSLGVLPALPTLDTPSPDISPLPLIAPLSISFATAAPRADGQLQTTNASPASLGTARAAADSSIAAPVAASSDASTQQPVRLEIDGVAIITAHPPAAQTRGDEITLAALTVTAPAPAPVEGLASDSDSPPQHADAIVSINEGGAGVAAAPASIVARADSVPGGLHSVVRV